MKVKFNLEDIVVFETDEPKTHDGKVLLFTSRIPKYNPRLYDNFTGCIRLHTAEYKTYHLALLEIIDVEEGVTYKAEYSSATLPLRPKINLLLVNDAYVEYRAKLKEVLW